MNTFFNGRKQIDSSDSEDFTTSLLQTILLIAPNQKKIPIEKQRKSLGIVPTAIHKLLDAWLIDRSKCFEYAISIVCPCLFRLV